MHPETILAQSQSNFNIAFWGLPKNQKRAMAAVYAFCRLVDDAVDESPDDITALNLLDDLRKQVEQLESPTNMLFSELQWSIQHFSMDISNLYWLMDGVQKDLSQKRYETWEDLFAYCDAVATSVGYMCMEVYGQRLTMPSAYVVATARALQLTNIARDIFVDGGINRIYIPKEHWAAYEISEDFFLEKKSNEVHAPLLRAFLQTAKAYYATSEKEKICLEPQKIWPAEVMKHVYFEIFQKIERNPLLVFQQKVSVPAWKKIWISRSQYIRSRFS